MLETVLSIRKRKQIIKINGMKLYKDLWKWQWESVLQLAVLSD